MNRMSLCGAISTLQGIQLHHPWKHAEFLAAHSETFIGRTEGGVKDKARNLVLKLKKAANNI